LVPATRFAQRAGLIEGSVIDSSTSLLQRQTHDVVPLAMGSPAPDAIPVDAVRAVAEEVLREAADALSYGPTEGERTLRAALGDFLAAQGDEVDPGRMLVTAGGMQGLDLVCKLWVDPGDLVVAESPTYTNGTGTIRSYEGSVLEAPIDGDGMVVEKLEELVSAEGRTPRLVYTVPTFQNPSGTTLSLERRVRLLELAEEWDALVLEDDPYGLLGFEGPPPPSLRALSGQHSRVVGVHTFSKILAPGLRVGWVVAAPEVVERMVRAKQAMDTCTNVPGQRIVAGILRRGDMDEHLARLRLVYRGKKEAMRSALEEHFGGEEGCSWTDPAGGLFLWLTLPEGVDAQGLFDVALAEGVAFIPGPAFSVSGGYPNALRLCFSYADEARTREGIARLRRAYDSFTSA
jgi:2-aminoadipate transaminase